MLFRSGYAPADNPTIAVAVSVEHGGFGGTTAGPIARKIFDAYLLGKMPEVETPAGEAPAVGRHVREARAPVVAAATPAPLAPAVQDAAR